MAADPKLVRDHFHAAAELPIPEREAYLASHCGDAELRAAVERLLAAHDHPASVFNRSALGGPEQTAAYILPERPGSVIASRYKLLELIGEGGMGAVWVAEQAQPVRRKVALKVIKAGMDSKSVLARFEAERQALAVMDHPNIAKVLDGGLTEAGRPFFVMEYVKGVPITEYCDATRLSIPERLQLFAQVCQAVQHAHQKGIIHRDLKPSNILVAPYDDKPVPKVIDFGLAKAMHQSLTERTLHTAHDTVLGTPLYMSPEQAQLNNLDVDTRSDVYSLGVLLYELLTGTTPLQKQRFKEAAWDEVRRIIREEEPPSPSSRLSSSTTLPSLAAVRHAEPAQLTKLVRGELDWIVMKALDKERSRRYETANGFALDIQRFLAGEAVLAAPPSVRYRLRKVARKHRAILTTAAAIAVFLMVGASVSTWQAVVARRAEKEAKNQRDAADNAREAEAAARAEATHLATNLEGQAYSLALALAQREWEAANIAQVQRLLDLCAPRLRRWEWDRLRYLCHLEERTIPAPGNHAGSSFLCWSPDGSRLASFRTSEERPAGSWGDSDYHENAQIISLSHEDQRVVLVPGVRKAAWDPNGQQLLVYQKDEIFARVDAGMGSVTKLWSLPVAKLGVFDVAWSLDGKRVAVSRSIRTGSNLRILDAGTGKNERVLAGHQEQVYAVAWSTDGKRLASASQDGTARIWDPDTGASLLTLTGHSGIVKAVAWSLDSSRIATGSQDQTARIWDARTGRMMAVLNGHSGTVNAVAWRPDGSSMATSSDDRTVRLWDTGTGRQLAILRGHADRVFELAWKPDGSRLASISDDQTIKIWDPFRAGESLDLIEHPAEVRAVAWSPENRLVATAGDDALVRLWDAATGRLILKFEGHTDPVYGVSFSPDGKRLATASTDGTARIWNVANGARVSKFSKHQEQVYAVAWSPDSQLVATGGSDRMLRIWDADTAAERLSVQATSHPDKGSISGVAWSPDGSRVALALTLPEKAVLVLDASTGRTLRKLLGHTHAVSAVAWSRDSRFLVSSSYDKTCRVWDSTTGEPRAILVGHGGFVYSVAWNHDGTRVATAGADGTIKVWDPSDGTEVLSLPGHAGNIWSVAWSPDGASLASAGADRRVRIWMSRAPVVR
jgi:WD40 repeat protein